MKRPFLTFMAAVVIPASLAMAAALFVAKGAWDELATESGRRVARLTLGTLSQDLGVAVDSLLIGAEALSEADTTLLAVRLALAGDTVTGLDPSDGGMDVFVMFPDSEAVAGLRFARGRLDPGAARLVGQLTGARIALFTDRGLWASTDPGPAINALDRQALLDASDSESGTALAGGALVAMDPREGTLPRITALAIPENAGRPPVSGAVRLVLGLTLLFSALAGWIMLEGRGGSSNANRKGAALVSLALVPALATVALLVHVHRTFEETTVDDISGDLTRSIAVVERIGLVNDPAAIRDMTGFDAVRVSNGVADGGTIEGDLQAFVSLPAPPPSFTVSGDVTTDTEHFRYVARRIDRQAHVLVAARVPAEDIAAVRRSVILIGLVLFGWLTLAGAAILSRRNRVSS